MSSIFQTSSKSLSFSINGHNGEVAFNVPLGNGPLVDDEYGCQYLESDYFDAESDYYLITLNGVGGSRITLGWLFPLNILKEDSDFYNDMDPYLLAYLHIGAHKLIEQSISNNQWRPLSGTLDDCGASDSLFLLIYRRSVLPDSQILELCPDLFRFGFSFTDKNLQTSIARMPLNAYRQEKAFDIHNSNCHRIHARLISPVFSDSNLVKALFAGNLSKLGNPLLRYFALYQIIEFLMSVSYRNSYYEYVEEFGNNRRHDLMEKFGELASEKRLIRNIFSFGTNDSIYRDFIDAAKSLLETVGESDFKSNPTFEDYMYKIRNLIVHSMHMVNGQMRNMRQVSDIFEYVVVDLMCRTTLVGQENKLLFVVDRNKSNKMNRRLFRQLLHELGI